MLLSNHSESPRNVALSRTSARLKSEITSLSKEMTTGIASDKTRHVNGNISLLVSLEQSIDAAQARKSIAQNVGSLLAAQQSVITGVREHSERIYFQLIQNDLGRDIPSTNRAISEMDSAFADTINLLNTSFSGRSLFSGAKGDGAALAPAQDILQALAADLQPDLDPKSLSLKIDDWFASGGGFDYFGYIGGDVIPAAYVVGETINVKVEITAQSVPIRQTLAGLAKGALLKNYIITDSPYKQRETLILAAETLMNSTRGLIDISAHVAEAEESSLRGVNIAEAEQTTMALVRAELLSVDPYDTATKLEHKIQQLELLYTLTVRLSRLTLVDYLR